MASCIEDNQAESLTNSLSAVSNIRKDKVHVRHCILYEFQQGKNVKTAMESISSVLGKDVLTYDVCAFWFRRFKEGEFSLIDRPRSGAPRTCMNEDLDKLLSENSAQTQTELAKQLGLCQKTVSNHLHEMGKIQKEGRWIPHQLSECNKNQRLTSCLSLLSKHRKKSFL